MARPLRAKKKNVAIAPSLPLPPPLLHTFTPISIEAIIDLHPEYLDLTNSEMNNVLPEPTHLSQHSLLKAPCFCISGECEAIRILKTYKPALHI